MQYGGKIPNQIFIIMGQNITIVMQSNKLNNIGMSPIKEKFCSLGFFPSTKGTKKMKMAACPCCETNHIRVYSVQRDQE